MRLQLRDDSWLLPPGMRAVARDRIRLALGRHMPAIEAVRASFRRARPRTPPRRGPSGRLVLTACLRDGRRLEVSGDFLLRGPDGLERFVDRQALRLARAVERAGESTRYPSPVRNQLDEDRAAAGPDSR